MNVHKSNSYEKVEIKEKLPKSFAETVDFLQTRINKTRYNQLNILSPKCKISYNPDTETYLFEDFYKNSNYLSQGSCSELQIGLYSEILKFRSTKYKYINNVVRCIGWDGGRNNLDGLYQSEGATHLFLLISPDNQIVPDSSTLQNLTIENQVFSKCNNSYIIDPSFKYISKYSDSGYTILGMDGEGYKRPRSSDLILEKDINVPLGVDIHGRLWCLSNHGNQNGLCIFEKSIKGTRDKIMNIYTLDYPNMLSLLGGDKVLFRAIQLI
jgi:hypothetical protein